MQGNEIETPPSSQRGPVLLRNNDGWLLERMTGRN